MLGLLYKDIIANKKNILLITLISVILMLCVPTAAYIIGESTIGLTENMLLLFSLATVFASFMMWKMILTMLMTKDETKKWAYFIISTSDGAKNQVGEKYVASFLLALAWFCISRVCISLTMDLTNTELDLTSVFMILFAFMLILNAIDLPFYFAFTTKNGAMVKAQSLIVLMIAALIYLLFGDLTIIKDLFGGANLSSLLSPDEQNVAEFDLFFILTAVIYYVSYKISSGVYVKGVTKYDR